MANKKKEKACFLNSEKKQEKQRIKRCTKMLEGLNTEPFINECKWQVSLYYIISITNSLFLRLAYHVSFTTAKETKQTFSDLTLFVVYKSDELIFFYKKSRHGLKAIKNKVKIGKQLQIAPPPSTSSWLQRWKSLWLSIF